MFSAEITENAEMIEKILFHIGHPAHVHLFKNTIWNLERGGYKVYVTVMDKEITLQLLDAYGFEYDVVGKNVRGLFNKAGNMVKVDLKLLKSVKKLGADLLVSVGSPYLAQVSALVRRPHVSFGDTENSKFDWLFTPFTEVFMRPSCYKKDVCKREIRYNGYHELAYLHPNYFKPNLSVLDDLGLSKADNFIILRFVSWDAHHDISDKGFTNILDAVKALEQYGRILITSEKKLPEELEQNRISVPSEKIHHLLYFATLYIGESATMASESAMLGTPSIFVSTSRRGYTDELESKYGLVYNFSDPEKGQEYALKKAVELLKNENIKSEWREKRLKMLSEKIDVTKFMTDFIENYPESFYECTNI